MFKFKSVVAEETGKSTMRSYRLQIAPDENKHRQCKEEKHWQETDVRQRHSNLFLE